ncbi:MAG: hypothetical protein PHQ96_08640 [Candidatus Omnitrophica bacterium]|nr:hypothetical protein [Candidatus Omnitrophota bacterium]
MKTKIGFPGLLKFSLLALLLFPCFALASDLSNKLNAARDSAVYLGNQIDELDKKVGDSLKEEKSRLSSTSELLQLREKHLNDQNTVLLKQMTGPGGYAAQYSSFKAKLDSFDAKCADYKSRCDRTFTEQSDVDACNQEKEQLDEESKPLHGESARLIDLKLKLKREKTELDDAFTMLNKQRSDLSSLSEKWGEKQKKYNAEKNELAVAYKQALEKLKQLSSQYAECIGGLPAQTNDKEIKRRCGDVNFGDIRKNILKWQNMRTGS